MRSQYAVGVLTRHLKCPTYASCKAASRVLNYLSQHPAVCVRYSGSSLDLHVYSDSDWGSNKDTRRSTSGVLIMAADGPVNWMSKLQPIVTEPSMEAEYLACFFAIQDIVWIRQLFKDINLERSHPTIVYIYQQSALQAHRHQVPLDPRQGSRSGYRAGPRANNGAESGLPYQDPSCG